MNPARPIRSGFHVRASCASEEVHERLVLQESRPPELADDNRRVGRDVCRERPNDHAGISVTTTVRLCHPRQRCRGFCFLWAWRNGGAAVSNTDGCRFESCRPCHGSLTTEYRFLVRLWCSG